MSEPLTFSCPLGCGVINLGALDNHLATHGYSRRAALPADGTLWSYTIYTTGLPSWNSDASNVTYADALAAKEPTARLAGSEPSPTFDPDIWEPHSAWCEAETGGTCTCGKEPKS